MLAWRLARMGRHLDTRALMTARPFSQGGMPHRGGGKVKHALEADGGFLAFLVAFADEPGPHGIV